MNDETVILGYLNLANISWKSGYLNTPFLLRHNVLLDQIYMIQSIQKNGYLTDEVTRRRYVNSTLQESTLDQILHTNDAIVSDFTVVSVVDKSDYMSIIIDFNSFEKQTAKQ